VWFVHSHRRDLRHGYEFLLRYLRPAQVTITSQSAIFRGCYEAEFTSREVLDSANDNEVDWQYIDPSKPQWNGYSASFNGSLRDECRKRKSSIPSRWPFGATATTTSDRTHH
jgi:hypothetical protein